MARVPARRGGPSIIDQYGLRPDRGVIALIIVYLVTWMLLRFVEPAGELILTHLALIPRRALGIEPWQLLTNGFIASEASMVFFMAITLVFFGNRVEQARGAAGLWKIYAIGVVGGSVFVAGMIRLLWPSLGGSPLFQLQGAGAAILVAYAMMMRGQRVMAYGVAEMDAGSIAWIWLGIALIGGILHMVDGHVVEGFITLADNAGGALAGWLYMRRGGVSLGGMRGSLDRWKLARMRRRYQVLDGGRKSDKRYLN